MKLRIAFALVGLLLPCWVLAQQFLDTYQKALDTVFDQSTNAERIVTLQVIPSFQPEWAVVFDRTPDGLVVSRVTLRKPLWPQILRGGSGSPMTASQSIELAKAAAVVRTPLPLPRESAQRFIDDLAKMDFTTDHCPRNKNGTCALIADGVMYVVQLRDGRSARLTGFGDLSGVRSENPALSNWVTELLKETSPPARK
jgi:hypothetical protein